jgi:predicted nicotinamide N-methyase
VDIDPWAETAVRLNAAANEVSVDFDAADLVGQDVVADVVLAGDVFYDCAFADAIVPWFEWLSGEGKEILVGDPGRAYLPKKRLELCATYEVPVTRALEDSEIKKTTVWRFKA